MFDADDNVQLVDLGMSYIIPSLYKAGAIVNKSIATFIAPEVIEGVYNKHSDIWSVGVIFFMLKFGQLGK